MPRKPSGCVSGTAANFGAGLLPSGFSGSAGTGIPSRRAGVFFDTGRFRFRIGSAVFRQQGTCSPVARPAEIPAVPANGFFSGAAGRLEALFAAPVPPRGVVAGYGLFSGAAGRLEAFLRRLFRGGDAEGCTFSGNRTTAEVLPLHPALRRRAERLPGFVTLLRTEGCLFRSGRKRAIVPEGAHRCEKEDDPPLWADRPSLVVAPGLPRFSGAFRAGAVFRRQRLFSFASMHSVAWGTFISRSLGMSFPVVLQMP